MSNKSRSSPFNVTVKVRSPEQGFRAGDGLKSSQWNSYKDRNVIDNIVYSPTSDTESDSRYTSLDTRASVIG